VVLNAAAERETVFARETLRPEFLEVEVALHLSNLRPDFLEVQMVEAVDG
jgi:hypothetical protein